MSKKKCPPHHWLLASSPEQREDGSKFFPGKCRNRGCKETIEAPVVLHEDWTISMKGSPEKFKARDKGRMADEVTN